ncbi:MAG: endo alpha-1,4 polygalactosaminidase [Actinomycetota bacterium]
MRSPVRLLVATLVLAVAVLVPTAAAAVRPAAPSVSPPSPVPCTGSPCWHPALSAHWQYQLQAVTGFASTGGINVGISAVPYTGGSAVHPDVFDIDLYVDQSVSGNNTTLNGAAVSAIHALGAKAICYVDAGTWENWRADAGAFPSSVLGRNNGWPGEKWLDIRQTSILLPIMQARVQKCVQAGFDGVEWDNVDGYSNNTNFPLTAADQIAYDASLANLAHQVGLTVALKNDVGQLSGLASYFDYAVNEQCQQYNECTGYTSNFINAGKAVFQVEYKLATSKFCTKANTANRNAIKKSLDLFDTPWTPCR